MKTSDLRELSNDELNLKLKEMQETMFRYRFQSAMGQLENPIKIRQIRRDIAKINTIRNEWKREKAAE